MCLLDGFVGDIALSRLENEVYEKELEEEVEREKEEKLAKMLAEHAKDTTESDAKTRHWTQSNQQVRKKYRCV